MTESSLRTEDNFPGWMGKYWSKMVSPAILAGHQINTTHLFFNGMLAQMNNFSKPFYTSLNSFNCVEKKKLKSSPLDSNIKDYEELYRFNRQILQKGTSSSINAMNRFHMDQMRKALSALICTFSGRGDEDIAKYNKKLSRLVEHLVFTYPEAIRNISGEYGFHFDEAGYIKTCETERMILYQVLPNEPGVKVQENMKPVIIIPPYVLGASILCFLPKEKKSYVHAYANQGVPTYIRIMKQIEVTPAVQTMTAEDDVKDTAVFCNIVKEKHNKAVTLNGFCQGGFIALIGILSGKLDGLVDALINCVAPMDGTRSKSLTEYLEHIPERFRDLGYALKPLANGNSVVDGEVMSWVYKLKSIEREAPLFSFYRDLTLFEKFADSDFFMNKTAAAINHWLLYDRTDLPLAITQLSFDSYTIAVDRDGNLPINLFGKKLNFKRLAEKEVRFLICYAERDDLVDADSALAPLDFIDAEVTVFPKGHGAIATSWSHPESACALHTTFGKGYRGPVKFQLDLNENPTKSKTL